MADSIHLNMFSVKLRSGIWSLASSYRLFTRRQFEYVVAASLMPPVEPELLEQYREDFVRGYKPTYRVEYPNPYDRKEMDDLLAMLRESFRYRPDSTHELVFKLKYFYVRAGLLIPVKADELVRALITGEGATSLDAGKPFEYRTQEVKGEIEQLAESTRNPDYAAKMLGYDRKTFGNMIHSMKNRLELRGDHNVIWHDNGDVEFRKSIIDNMHNYAP
ncbi:hypothetical protein NK8_27220 [Caballeronia sp. NK8]|uniref:hypothetical protein n=1 Tax=Caballeronia sp. NK8 TaxID=140098 RepID=UPI001BB6C9DD|nr:hypothetical protein [Caballeronia sp. NK8]BCQ24548.1 hypothetical protein NK8_27220 [Caballeronia sp. NK8]